MAQNGAEAVRWYRLAAERLLSEWGKGGAYINLAIMYRDGEGVAQNYPEALRLFRLMAERRITMAYYQLAIMYHDGKGVAQNYPEAVRWFRLSRRAG